MMRTVIKTAPATEPLTLAEAKLHAKVEVSDDDALIAVYIQAAREIVENYTSRALITQVWHGYLDRFPTSCDPDGNAMVLPRPPLVSVGLLEYTPASNGARVPLVADTDFVVDAIAEPGRVLLAPTKSWPAIGELPNPVHLEFTCGYGAAAAVPAGIKQAIQVLVADMYDNRSPVPTSFAEAQMRHLLAPFVLGRLW